MPNKRLVEALKFQARLNTARAQLVALYVNDDIQQRSDAIEMILRIMDAEIDAVVKFEEGQEAAMREAEDDNG